MEHRLVAFRGAGVWPVNRNNFAVYLFAAATAVETHFTKQEKVDDGSAGSTNQTIFIENAIAAENSSISRSSVTKTPINTDKVPAVILTSTPYKETLEEKQRQTDKENIDENKKRKANEESKHKKKDERKNPQERERKVPPQNKRTRWKKSLLDKATVNLFSEIQNKPKRRPGKKTSPYLTESDEDNDENTEELCLYCLEKYYNSKPNEGWARCQNSSKWAHEQCEDKEDEDFN
ncbi:hypothetical protein JTB14_003205 [Gonioctena quinquepunctata]|nr:hypothetical protein JTB14_003205 [Gonioctena quinquepunctata]